MSSSELAWLSKNCLLLALTIMSHFNAFRVHVKYVRVDVISRAVIVMCRHFFSKYDIIYYASVMLNQLISQYFLKCFSSVAILSTSKYVKKNLK